MARHTSVFHAFADPAAGADAEARPNAAGANVPENVNPRVGIVNKQDKSCLLTRYDVTRPFSGPALPLNGRIIVTKAKVTFRISTGLVADDVTAFSLLGIMRFAGLWVRGDNGFDVARYPTMSDLPYTSEENDTIPLTRLYNDAFLVVDGTDPQMTIFPFTHAAEMFVTYGEGYPGTSDFPGGVNNVYADRFTNFASELTSYLQSGVIDLPPGSPFRPVIAISLDAKFVPPSADEFYRIYSADSAGDGVVLTIEWNDLAGVARAGSRVSTGIQSVAGPTERVRADYDVRERIFAASQVTHRIKTAGARVRPRVLAPGSGPRAEE